jgi:amino acid adenylation domain-containing protein
MDNAIQSEVYEFPLSLAQKRLWVLSQFEGANVAYNMTGMLELDGPFRADVFGRCAAEMMDRHESLRTTFTQRGGELVQVVHGHLPLPLTFLDLSGGDAAANRAAVAQRLEAETRTPFDLENGPLFRLQLLQLAPGQYALLFCMHHIIADGWSLGIFVRELSTLYNAFVRNQPSPLPPLPVQYADFSLWQQEWIAAGGLDGQLAYWKKRLADAPALLELPTDGVRPAVQTYQGALFPFALPETLAARVYQSSREHGVSVFMLLLAAYQVLLYRYTQQTDVVVGSPAANRGRQELEHLIGFFVNTLVLRTDLGGNPTFAELLQRVKETTLGAFDHQDVTFEKILEEIKPERSPSYNPVFQVMFSLENFGDELPAWGDVRVRMHRVEGRFAKFDLTLAMREHQGQLQGAWEYNPALFTEETIARMAGQFRLILEAAVGAPGQPIDAINLLTAAEAAQLETWNRTEAAYPQEACFFELFEAQARLTPRRTAVVDEAATLTYQQVNERANRLARRLLEAGVAPGTPVGVCLGRSADLPVVLLAVMKTGAAYIPLDPAYPADRIAFILEDAAVPLVVSQAAVADALPPSRARVLLADEAPEVPGDAAGQDLGIRVAPSAPVYIIYTSGSTGQPKGVRVPQRALVNFLFSMAQKPGIGADDRLLAVTSLSFDIAGLELYLPLLVGAAVVVAGREAAADGELLARLLEQHNITLMQATPSTWRLLLGAGWEGKADLKVLCGGEAFSRDLANRLVALTASVWNMYGPTETTIWSTVQRVEASSRPVPIGTPIANTQIYLLDANGRPVPVGVPGELYIGGDGLALDYLGRPALTAEKFVPHPFRDAPARLFRTGDLARFLPGGAVEFLGRKDFQVKVNGFRIELGEIESQLEAVEGIAEAVAVARGGEAGGKRIVAYLQAPETGRPSVERLRAALQKKLPAYMIPATFVYLDALPRTPNGKTDRKALPEPVLDRGRLETAYQAPVTGPEKVLSQVWAEVLGVAEVGVHDNFFTLGGASLQSIQVANRATAAGLLVKPEMLFEHQTVHELARAARPVAGLSTGRTWTDQPEVVLTPDLVHDHQAPAPDAAPRQNLIIESLAAYLPPNEVTSRAVVQGCANPVRFPLERLTGIYSRRVVGENEYAIDLAARAMEKCFAQSGYGPGDIDVLLSCNVFRMDGPQRIALEPSTAVRLKQRFGCDRAIAFDISNACAGIFTGIVTARALVGRGVARRVMLVSGEYLTHLTDTAQHEIVDYMDSRISALTVGDSGLAMILEASADPARGFLDVDMFTMGGYSDLCVVKATREAQGGLILNTDAIRMAEAGHAEASRHALRTLKKNRWAGRDIDYIIMHQASSTTTANTMREVNRIFNDNFANPDNTIDNIRERGNTGTTTHWLAVLDTVARGRITAGDRVTFCISGSGLNLGTALYTFDDLPERLRRFAQTGEPAPKRERVEAPGYVLPRGAQDRVRIAGTGLVRSGEKGATTALDMAAAAAEGCLARVPVNRQDIGLVIYGGVYRDEFLFEPAMATLLTGRLNINATVAAVAEDRRSLVFDVFNGGVGFLQSLFTAIHLLEPGPGGLALVATAEVENNAALAGRERVGLEEAGSALLLANAPASRTGFGNFVFRTFPEHLDAYTTEGQWRGAEVAVEKQVHAGYARALAACIAETLPLLLEKEGLSAGDVNLFFPPQLPGDFHDRLAAATGLAAEKLVQVPGLEKDLFTSSIPFALDYAERSGLVRPGDVGVLIGAGSGIQVGCAVYYF